MKFIWLKEVSEEECLNNPPMANGRCRYVAIHLCDKCIVKMRDTLTAMIERKDDEAQYRLDNPEEVAIIEKHLCYNAMFLHKE